MKTIWMEVGRFQSRVPGRINGTRFVDASKLMAALRSVVDQGKSAPTTRGIRRNEVQ